PQDTVEIDPTGKRSGRGAYICPRLECLQKAIKAKRLEKALQRSIAPEIIQSLTEGLKE
ncbi:MAG: YlxR family protein, partial [Acetobacteraceae bacterium]|nr:YlxR family protein [Acetobacteraceae bacterium]